MKNPLTPSGIEPATFRFVTQHLNHCATAVPVKLLVPATFYRSGTSFFHPKEERQVYGCSGKYLDLKGRNLKKRQQYTTGSFAICRPPLHQIYNQGEDGMGVGFTMHINLTLTHTHTHTHTHLLSKAQKEHTTYRQNYRQIGGEIQTYLKVGVRMWSV